MRFTLSTTRVMVEYISKTYDRELATLADQLEAYPDQESIWSTPDGITNSAGTLALHMCGNLRHFLGMAVAGTEYVRDRPFEFAGTPVGTAELLQIIKSTRHEVAAALAKPQSARFDEPFPLPIGGVQLTVGQAIIHLLSHLAYHLGQVDYHRRLTLGDNTSVGALSIPRIV
ncbi:MAG: DUF1572 family protein [Rhodothermales bacterium]|nr:DUF1572 family protein [Rhodothermales bacterium]